jgi:hypothetical protein
MAKKIKPVDFKTVDQVDSVKELLENGLFAGSPSAKRVRTILDGIVRGTTVVDLNLRGGQLICAEAPSELDYAATLLYQKAQTFEENAGYIGALLLIRAAIHDAHKTGWSTVD